MEVNDVTVLAYAAVVAAVVIGTYVKTRAWGMPAMVLVAAVALPFVFGWF